MESKTCHQALYKTQISSSEDRQEQRRKLLLLEQKLQRYTFQDEDRLPLINSAKNSSYLRDIKSSLFEKKYNIPCSVQLSEWLKEKPQDLNKWYLVPCPKGQRCLIIACNGITEAYNKKNKRIFYFHSMLPGDGTHRTEKTVLDCIFCDKLKTFFVLDAIILANHNLQYCEASFRFYWIKSRFNDNDNYHNIGSYSFTLINWIDFEEDNLIKMCFMKYPSYENNVPELDGFLFYHKEASYSFGSTPLVGWLFPYMVPEVLSYEINCNYMLQRPCSYINYLHFIKVFNENFAKKCLREIKPNSKDTSMSNNEALEID